MRKFIPLLLALVMVTGITSFTRLSSTTSAAGKIHKKVQEKVNDLAHKKRMKKAERAAMHKGG